MDGAFDIVASFNNLDHVDDVERTIAEIKRVTAVNGRFLLITEVGHAPTLTEPHRLDRSIVQRFAPEFSTASVEVFKARADHDGYRSIRDGIPSEDDRHPGWLCSLMVRCGATCP